MDDDPDTLVLIDTQRAFHDPVWGPRNNPAAEENLRRLLAVWREAQAPVVHIRHDSTSPNSPLHPSHTGNAPIDGLEERAGEPVLRKTVNSGFIGTPLETHLRERGVRRLVIAGITTDHCVSTTVRM
ncbi:MAG: isochorismatase family protein, partial [Pseudomonadota bacterium]